MILFLFAVIIPAIFIIGVARYNEDDRLTKKLLLSYCVALAVTCLILAMSNTGTQNKACYDVKVSPMQLSNCALGQSVLLGNAANLTTVDTEMMSVAAGKDTNFGINVTNLILDEIYANVRDQPPQLTPEYINDS